MLFTGRDHREAGKEERIHPGADPDPARNSDFVSGSGDKPTVKT